MKVTTFASGLLLAIPFGILMGCGSTTGSAPESTGGASATGGKITATGGIVATGGVATGGITPATGGVKATGGTTPATGGEKATGGATPATGGEKATGGTTPTTGGEKATGGTSPATGGVANTGGSKTTDGGVSTGGNKPDTAIMSDAPIVSSEGYPLGNPAVPSAGCGKALSTFKSGANTTYKITSASLAREYIMYIPANYDSNKPYRLVFGMHCMGSSDTQCANTEGFYRLKPLDTGNTTIFVAPQGYTDSSPWRGGDNKDHVLFEDLVKLFTSELCIDTSRIFSVGFSFGAMFTNSLAQTHQDILRGVVVFATADYNIYFPTNTGKPLAYMGVHGTADGTCPFKTGKSSIERFVKNNKCTGTPVEATSSTHVVFDYTCPSNYPVKWATHNGGHTDLPKDPNQSTSWAIDMNWKFITQF